MLTLSRLEIWTFLQFIRIFFIKDKFFLSYLFRWLYFPELAFIIVEINLRNLFPTEPIVGVRSSPTGPNGLALKPSITSSQRQLSSPSLLISPCRPPTQYSGWVWLPTLLIISGWIYLPWHIPGPRSYPTPSSISSRTRGTRQSCGRRRYPYSPARVLLSRDYLWSGRVRSPPSSSLSSIYESEDRTTMPSCRRATGFTSTPCRKESWVFEKLQKPLINWK